MVWVLDVYLLLVSEGGGVTTSVTMKKSFGLPFVPYPGLGLLYGEDEDGSAHEVSLENVSWDCELQTFSALNQQRIYDSDPAAEAAYYEASGWEVASPLPGRLRLVPSDGTPEPDPGPE